MQCEKSRSSPRGHLQGAEEEFKVLLLALQGKGQADGPLAEGVGGREGESKGRIQAPERRALISGFSQKKADPVCIESDPDREHKGCGILSDGAEKRADSIAFEGRSGKVVQNEFSENPSSAGFFWKILRVQLFPGSRRGTAGERGKGGFQICFSLFQEGKSLLKFPFLEVPKSLLPFFLDSRVRRSQIGLHRKARNEGSSIGDLEEFPKTEQCKIPFKPDVSAQRSACAIFDQERTVFGGPRAEPGKGPMIRESEIMDD